MMSRIPEWNLVALQDIQNLRPLLIIESWHCAAVISALGKASGELCCNFGLSHAYDISVPGPPHH